jgi:hypothetical protein
MFIIAKPLSIVSESDRTCLLYLTYTPGCVEILRMEYDGILKCKFISIFMYSHVGFLFEHTEILDRHIGHNFKIFFMLYVPIPFLHLIASC